MTKYDALFKTVALLSSLLASVINARSGSHVIDAVQERLKEAIALMGE